MTPGPPERLGHWLGDHPQTVVALLILGQVALWTLGPALTYASLPLDVVENLVWGREWQWGYAKHPPLQAWLVEGALMLSGRADWGVYLAAQGCLAITYGALFLLGRDLAGAFRAALGVMLFSLVFYAHIPTPELNANVVQMPAWAVAGLALWRALERDRLGWWLLLGCALALGLYGKYSLVFLVAALAVALLTHPAGPRALLRPGLWAGAGLALLLALPHLAWLVDSGGQPIAYAMARAEPLEGWDRLTGPLMFLLAQVADHAGMLLVLALGLGVALRDRGRAALAGGVFGETAPRATRFVLALAIGPLAAMVLYSLATGGALRDMWGGPAVIWISLAVALALPSGVVLSRPVVGRMAGLWLILFLAFPLVTAAAVAWGPALTDSRPARVGWPAEALARDLIAVWERETNGRPLTLVGGQTWRAGLVLHSGDLGPEASGYINADPALNPWITPERIAAEGLLMVWRGPGPSPYPFPGPVAAQGSLETAFPQAPGHSVVTGWAVIAPTEARP